MTRRNYSDLCDVSDARFLRELAASEVNVTSWEATFIESNLGRDTFSLKQRATVQRLREKYEHWI